MATFDTVIRNGNIVDGTGAPAFVGDVGIVDGRIAAIGNLKTAKAAEDVDARGKIVAPGYITQHSHYDAALFWSPHCMDSGQHGVTSILYANCGFSVAPVRPADIERTMAMLSTTEQIPVEQQRIALPWDWETFPEYLERVRALPKSVNVMTYMPMNPLLVYVMGVDAAKSRRPTGDEMKEMHRLINEAMDHGAMGISMSVMGIEGNSHVDYDGSPMPTDSLHDDDIVELSRALVERGEGIVQLLAQIAHYGNRAVTEKVARMAKGSGVRVLHDTFLASEEAVEMIDSDLAWIDGLRADGLDVVAATNLFCGWVEAGIRDLDTAAGQLNGVRKLIACRNDDEIRVLLGDPDFVADFASEYAAKGASNGAGGFEGQIVIEVGSNPDIQNCLEMTLADVAAERGVSVVEALCGLALESELALQIKSRPWAAENAHLGARLLRHTAVASGVSDGGAHTKAFSSGSYGTEMMVRMVREQKAMTVEEMHHQQSLKIARILHIKDRGALLPGFWADILIYDPDALYFDRSRFGIVHDLPGGDWRRLAHSGGYDRIFVNGVTTFQQDLYTHALPGRFLGGSIGDEGMLAVAAE